MKTWLLCESCIHAESNSETPRHSLIKECSDCAKACFAIVSRLVSEQEEVGDIVLDCVLHCRQCAIECNRYYFEADLLFCADICCECAETVKELATFSLN